MPKRLFILSILVLPCLSLILSFINIWFLLTLLISVSAPCTFSMLETKRLDAVVAKIAPKFTYSDIIDMIETGEWSQIAIKVRAEKNAATTDNTTANQTTPIRVKNSTRNLSALIINDEENNVSVDGDV